MYEKHEYESDGFAQMANAFGPSINQTYYTAPTDTDTM